MKANINDNPLIKYDAIPTTWRTRPKMVKYHEADPSIHYEDGFRDLVLPQLSSFEDMGQIRYSEVTDNFTYEVIPWSEERIKQQSIDKAGLAPTLDLVADPSLAQYGPVDNLVDSIDNDPRDLDQGVRQSGCQIAGKAIDMSGSGASNAPFVDLDLES
jgi:hypothetical protein